MTEGIPRHSVSVAAALVDERGRMLAIRRRDNGQWEPPGGLLELDETIQEGLIREVQEETGLVIEPDRLTGVYKNIRRGVVALVFRCRILSGNPVPTRETAEVRWLTPEDVAAVMDEAYSTRLLDALRAGPPAIRAHDGSTLLPATQL